MKDKSVGIDEKLLKRAESMILSRRSGVSNKDAPSTTKNAYLEINFLLFVFCYIDEKQ